MSMSIEELIGGQAESTADWRRMKAKEFPDDTRNLTAAESLDRLAAELCELEGSGIHHQIDDLMDRIADSDAGADVYYELNEEVSSALRSVGFHGSWSGAGFLEWYRDTLETLYRKHVGPTIKVREDRVRRALGKHGYRLAKVPARSWIRTQHGVGYMVADDRNHIRLGSMSHAYDATLDEVEAFALRLTA